VLLALALDGFDELDVDLNGVARFLLLIPPSMWLRRLDDLDTCLLAPASLD